MSGSYPPIERRCGGATARMYTNGWVAGIASLAVGVEYDGCGRLLVISHHGKS